MWRNAQKFESILEEDGILFLAYGGGFTQSLIAGMTEVLEKETEVSDLSMKVSHRIFVVFIELSQNIMNYAVALEKNGLLLDPKGLIFVGKKEDNYFVCSQNIVTGKDKAVLEQDLETLLSMSEAEVKQAYKSLRKSGDKSHAKGGGLGFLEIAKKSKKIEYVFEEKGADRFYFKICAHI